MRILLYIVILSLLFFAPLERLDVAELQPVQTVAMRVAEDTIELKTDTGNKGVGKTVAEAVADLEAKTPGVIYMDTAQFLLLTDEAVSHAEELRQYLHPGVLVCIWDGEGSVAGAASYLCTRNDLPQFRHWDPSAKKVEKSKK